MKRKLDGQHLVVACRSEEKEKEELVDWWFHDNPDSHYIWLMVSSNKKYPVYFLLSFRTRKLDSYFKNFVMNPNREFFLIMCDWKYYGWVPEWECMVAFGEIPSTKQIEELTLSAYEAPGQQ